MGKDKQRLPEAAREGQSLHQSRKDRMVKLCTKMNPCGRYYAIDAYGNPIDTSPQEPASPFDVSHDPLASVSLSDTLYDDANARTFTEPFYALFGDTTPRSEILRYLPFLAEAARRLQTDDPLYHALLVERYTLKRSMRALSARYTMHHDTLDAVLHRALTTLRNYIDDAQHLAATEAC